MSQDRMRLWVAWPTRRPTMFSPWSWARRILVARIDGDGAGSVLRGRTTFSRQGVPTAGAGLAIEGVALAQALTAPRPLVPVLLYAVITPVFAAGLFVAGLWRARNDDEMLRVWVATRSGAGTD